MKKSFKVLEDIAEKGVKKFNKTDIPPIIEKIFSAFNEYYHGTPITEWEFYSTAVGALRGQKYTAKDLETSMMFFPHHLDQYKNEYNSIALETYMGLFISAAFNRISDKCDECTLNIKELGRIDLLGFGQHDGKLIVKGNLGSYVGKNRSHGDLIIHGDVMDELASHMSGGTIKVYGNITHVSPNVKKGEIYRYGDLFWPREMEEPYP